jgi:hypothetical protein
MKTPCFLFTLLLVLGLRPHLAAQTPYKPKLPENDPGIVYQFQLRVSRAGTGLESMVGSRNGGGIGFSAMFGDDFLRLRLRMDGDGFPGKDGKGAVTTSGAGVEGVLFLPSFPWATPYVSCGAAFQHWEIGQNDQVPARSRTTNHLAGRAELGLRLRWGFQVTLGVLYGKTVDGQTAANPYLALAL